MRAEERILGHKGVGLRAREMGRIELGVGIRQRNIEKQLKCTICMLIALTVLHRDI